MRLEGSGRRKAEIMTEKDKGAMDEVKSLAKEKAKGRLERKKGTEGIKEDLGHILKESLRRSERSSST